MLAIGGNSRNVGKTSLAVSIIGATREARWTALKVCSTSGEPCSCAVSDPSCPFDISVEDGLDQATDTGRMLEAGASEVLWVRVAQGQLPLAIPAIRRRLEGRVHVLFESNSIVEFLRPQTYLSVLQFDSPDCKASARRLAPRADAFVVAPANSDGPAWDGFDARVLEEKPKFAARPPSYCTPEILDFVKTRMTATGGIDGSS